VYFDRYDIVAPKDLLEAARKLNKTKYTNVRKSRLLARSQSGGAEFVLFGSKFEEVDVRHGVS
jgi:hypothetical protein